MIGLAGAQHRPKVWPWHPTIWLTRRSHPLTYSPVIERADQGKHLPYADFSSCLIFTTNMTRRIPFQGDDSAYILFLETRVLELEDSIHHQSQQDAYTEGSSASQADLSEVRDQHEAFEPSCHNTSQIQPTSEIRNHDGDTQLVLEGPDEQRHADSAGGDFPTFKIIEFNPNADLNADKGDKCAQAQGRKQQLRKLSIFSEFLDNLPQSDSWKDWTSALDKLKCKGTLLALIQDSSSPASSFTSLETPQSSPNVPSKPANISILSEYADFMISFGVMNRQLACFREFIFVSLCAVALEIFENKDEVYEVMRKILGSKAFSKQLLKLVRGAKWANSLISLLSKTKWVCRSWDIICVGMFSMLISFYKLTLPS